MHPLRPRPPDPGPAVRALPYLVFALGWSIVAIPTRHHLNPDGASYLSVAERWLAGDWSTAVNGYWGPVYSWLLAPLLAVGVPPVPATRLAILVGAVAALVLCERWLVVLGVHGRARSAALLAIVPLLVWHAHDGAYPEVVLAAVLLAYALAALGPAFRDRPGVALLTGVLGGVAYLVKSFALPLVLVHLVVVAGLHLWARPDGVVRRRVLRHLGLAVAGVALVAVPWVAALSATYGELTVTTTGRFNAELVGSAGNPLLRPGIFPLPYPEAASAWDDPSELRIEPRKGGGGGSPTWDRLEPVVDNLRTVVDRTASRAAVPVALAAAGVGLALRRRAARDEVIAVLGLAAVGALTVGGYSAVIVIERYLWFPMLLAALLAGTVVGRLERHHRGAAAGVAVVLGLATTGGAALALRHDVGLHADVAVAARTLDAGRFDGAAVAAVSDRTRTVALCARLGCHHLGQTHDEDGVEVVTPTELWDAGIDLVVEWVPTDASPTARERDEHGVRVAAVTEAGLVPWDGARPEP